MNRAISSLAVLAVLTPTSLAWAEEVPSSAPDVGTEPAAPVAPAVPATNEPAPAPPAPPIASAEPMEPGTSTAAGPTVVDQPSATDTSTEEHSGFFLGLQIPIGRLKVGDDDRIFEASGVGGGFTLLIGGTPAPNLVIYGEASSVQVSGPEMTIGGDTTSADSDTSVALVQFGPGIVYYFMPINFYVGGSLLLSRVAIDHDGETVGETKLGIGAALRAGREFWVGKDWGLGIGVEARAASMQDKDVDATLTASSFGLTLGATYH